MSIPCGYWTTGGTQIKNSSTLTREVHFTEMDLYQIICGIHDDQLSALETELGVTIIPRGKGLILKGSFKDISFAEKFFSQLEDNFSQRPDKKNFDSFDFQYILKNAKLSIGSPREVESPTLGSETSHDFRPQEKVFTNFKGKSIFPRTFNQEEFVKSLKDNYITFALGPAGTGKTFLSIAHACKMIAQNEVERLILTRPAVEAGESLGYLPGDLAQKVNPYLRPIYDALHECIGLEKTQEYIAIGRIEIAPIAFMRGRTLANSFIILDEAQNCSFPQLKMFLTRFGKNSKMSIVGDRTQIDLEPGRSGLDKAVSVLKSQKGIGTIYFGKEDITRHPIVEVIVRRFEEAGL